ncbi:hypothetical protein [Sphingopyxis panaciterrae]
MAAIWAAHEESRCVVPNEGRMIGEARRHRWRECARSAIAAHDTAIGIDHEKRGGYGVEQGGVGIGLGALPRFSRAYRADCAGDRGVKVGEGGGKRFRTIGGAARELVDKLAHRPFGAARGADQRDHHHKRQDPGDHSEGRSTGPRERCAARDQASRDKPARREPCRERPMTRRAKDHAFRSADKGQGASAPAPPRRG